MADRFFRLLLDDKLHLDFHRAQVEEASRQVVAIGEAIGSNFTVDVKEAFGNQERQLRQAAELGLFPDSEDLIGLMPIASDALGDLLDAIFASHLSASPSERAQPKRSQLVCAVLHQILPPALVLKPNVKQQRIFSVAADQLMMGRLQAEQIVRLLSGRTSDQRNMLYVTGPEYANATRLRIAGAVELLLQNGVNVQARHADWDGSDAQKVMESWQATGGKLEDLDLVAAHADVIAKEIRAYLVEHDRSDIPVLGMDGTDLGKKLIEKKDLLATVVQPPGVIEVLEIYRELVLGRSRTEDLREDRNYRLVPTSHPLVESLPILPPRHARV